MSRSQTDSIRGFILDRVAESPHRIAPQVTEAYGISRQAANRHLDALVEEGILEQSGFTRSREYRLRRESLLNRELRVTPVLNPQRLWDDHIAPVLAQDQPEVREVCRGAFCDVIRNTIAHAAASWITVDFQMTARHIEISVEDDGNGFFHHLAKRYGFLGTAETVEEFVRRANKGTPVSIGARLILLARNFDWFEISSAGTCVAYFSATESWSTATGNPPGKGTRVSMRLRRAVSKPGAASVLLAQTFRR